MMIYPRTDWGTTAALIAVPVVGILVWLFNSYKLGRIGRRTAVLCGAVLLAVAGAALAVILK